VAPSALHVDGHDVAIRWIVDDAVCSPCFVWGRAVE
jgi:hypothetical protein